MPIEVSFHTAGAGAADALPVLRHWRQPLQLAAAGASTSVQQRLQPPRAAAAAAQPLLPGVLKHHSRTVLWRAWPASTICQLLAGRAMICGIAAGTRVTRLLYSTYSTYMCRRRHPAACRATRCGEATEWRARRQMEAAGSGAYVAACVGLI
jgi:hypothetical protein